MAVVKVIKRNKIGAAPICVTVHNELNRSGVVSQDPCNKNYIARLDIYFIFAVGRYDRLIIKFLSPANTFVCNSSSVLKTN